MVNQAHRDLLDDQEKQANLKAQWEQEMIHPIFEWKFCKFISKLQLKEAHFHSQDSTSVSLLQ